MNDMSSRQPMPSATDHEHHDALLVSQLVAGDPLAPEQQAEAQRLIAGCGACAVLAADLRIVSAAVAQEPVPPRGRDFRLSPEQAEQLSGNALTRFLRGLSLPTARAFQPAAAGLLSIGLLFVVAGYAWPDGGTIVVQAEPNLATYGETESAPPPATEATAPTTDLEIADDLAAADAVVLPSLEPGFLETLPESQAGNLGRSNQKSVASEAAPAEEEDALSQRLEQSAPEAPAAAEDLEFAEALDADEAASRKLGGVAADGVAEEPVDGAEFRASVPASEPDTSVSAGDGAVAEAELSATLDEAGPEELLIVLGLLLVLGGGGLLLLGWLVRRSRDPLLR